MMNEGIAFDPFHIGQDKKIKYIRIAFPCDENVIEQGDLAVSKVINRQINAAKKRLDADRRIRAGGRSTKKPLVPLKKGLPRNGLYVPNEMKQPSHLSIRASLATNSTMCSSSRLPASHVGSRSRQMVGSNATLPKQVQLESPGNDGNSRFPRSHAGDNQTEIRSHVSQYNCARQCIPDGISRGSGKPKASDHRAHDFSVTEMKIYPRGCKANGSTTSSRTLRVSPSFKQVATSIKEELAKSLAASKLLAAKTEELNKCLQTVLSH